jgi:hypothetical protein
MVLHSKRRENTTHQFPLIRVNPFGIQDFRSPLHHSPRCRSQSLWGVRRAIRGALSHPDSENDLDFPGPLPNLYRRLCCSAVVGNAYAPKRTCSRNRDQSTTAAPDVLDGPAVATWPGSPVRAPGCQRAITGSPPNHHHTDTASSWLLTSGCQPPPACSYRTLPYSDPRGPWC